MTRLPVRCYDTYPDVHIFSALIRISYLSTSGVESESPQKNYEGVVGLYFFFLVSYKADVGRSVGCLFVHSFIHRSVGYSKFPSIFSSPFVIRHSSFVVHLPDYCKPRISSES